MADTVNVALDAMGGDNAPDEMIRGAIDAVKIGRASCRERV